MVKELIEVFSPAKINLFLGVVGKREDGFHELLSLITTVNFGDNLKIQLVEDQDSINCDYAGIPPAEENIVMKAIESFRRKYAFENGVQVSLNKKIPIGAGLGGGSSNAVALLNGLNELLGQPLDSEDLKEIAIGLGSDCALFFANAPVLVRGRGEIIDDMDKKFHEKIMGQRILIFMPAFSVNTKWAYNQLSLNPDYYIKKDLAESTLADRMKQFLANGDLGKILYNNFERVIFEKHKKLGELMKNLKKQFNVDGLLSGSGSSCFCILKEKSDVSGITAMIKEVLGKDVFMIETTIC